MDFSSDYLGEIANVAQITGLDYAKLIALIVKAANNARMHKKNCRRFANHLKLIGNLLAQLRVSDLKEWPETREPLELFEDALRRAYVLVNSCQDKSYLYLLAVGWTIVSQFRQSQEEIDAYLKLIPLIQLVDNKRVREKLQAIEKDKQEYTLEEEEKKMHETLLKSECTLSDSFVLRESLSRRYPDLAFEEALQTENEKLQEELQRVVSCHKTEECDVIKHLIDVTETAATVPSENEEVESKRYYQHSLSHNSHQSEEGGGNGSPDAKIRKSQKGQKCAVM
ncbi:hypothetical protein SUGI_0762630 [Cryptomeria japonica]|uniref:protein MID1-COMPLEMENTING ACTIVITY 1 n=1 Tax=Cryptomeria japonica TaxID=3369 RepID=UPI002414BA82|nr:protein MID1-COMPLEMENTING ACTIVITY 1 [Cryptomeria japonica]GLJ37531.1 hypothetical protein SUGI_0762630 [Cryptomeria japonica]